MREDHQEELDILYSIYPEEVTVLGETSLLVELALETTPPRTLQLHIELPETYPDTEVPSIQCTFDKIATASETKTDNFTYNLSSDDLKLLNAKAKELATEMIGMPSLYSIISGLKEEAEMLHDKGVADLHAARTRELDLEEAKEQAKFHGTPVTKESFAAWRLKFRAELGKDVSAKSEALTGKEIFERGIQGDSDDENDDDEAEIVD